MPRLSPHQLRAAHNRDLLLPLLLRACRDLPSAASELRWLRERVNTLQPNDNSRPQRKANHLRKLCLQRSSQKPLQYILGDTPFGDLSIQCKPGVLIPRWETAEYTTHLAHLLIPHPNTCDSKPLRILDLCTGTGCVLLLLHSLLCPHFPHLECLGIDISQKAISLAQQNIDSNIAAGALRPEAGVQIRFQQADIFSNDFLHNVSSNCQKWDILISNPPYISPKAFERTARSVRNWEPLAALVPPHKQPLLDPGNQEKKLFAKADNFRYSRPLHVTSNTTNIDSSTDEKIGDNFYPRLLHLAQMLDVKAALFEVADVSQARRVVGMIESQGESRVWKGREIWRDLPAEPIAESSEELGGQECIVRGNGNVRSVMMWSGDGRGFFGRKGKGG